MTVPEQLCLYSGVKGYLDDLDLGKIKKLRKTFRKNKVGKTRNNR